MGAPKLAPKSSCEEDTKAKAREDKILISQYIDRIRKMVKSPQKAKQAAQILEDYLNETK